MTYIKKSLPPPVTDMPSISDYHSGTRVLTGVRLEPVVFLRAKQLFYSYDRYTPKVHLTWLSRDSLKYCIEDLLKNRNAH